MRLAHWVWMCALCLVGFALLSFVLDSACCVRLLPKGQLAARETPPAVWWHLPSCINTPIRVQLAPGAVPACLSWMQAAVPLPRLEAVLGVQDALWLQRLAQGKDAEEVKPRTLPKSISCGKTFRGVNVLTSLTAVHTWLVQLGHELQERIEADRQQHQRLPKLLTVSFDSAPLDAGGAEAGPAQNPTAAAAAAAGAGADSRENGSRSGPSHGRLTAQNWRAGATNISRSTTLRHARSDAIASDALGLVKKWARDR